MDKTQEALKLAQDWYASGNEDPDEFTAMIKAVMTLAEQSAQQCWKCGDMDAAGHAKCTVPACGMREQAAQRKIPQNCGTGYCSCIECLKEPAEQKMWHERWLREKNT